MKTDSELLGLLQNSGDQLLDTRNTISRARINLTSALDEDNDGEFTPADNCTLLANTPGNPAPMTACDDQEDGDSDGYGNPCDTDVNNNGATDQLDVGLVLLAAAQGSTDPKFDFNCNGTADLLDVGRTLADSAVAKLPGPSGLSCITNPPTAGSCP